MRIFPGNGEAALRQRFCLRAIIVILFLALFLPPLTAQQRPSRQSSLEAYSKGDYELAYREFSELLVSYPKDPLYKYYTGVCLVRLKREPDNAVRLLSEAKESVAVVRSVPPDVLFWLGRAHQLSGRYKEAVDSYNLYTSRSGKKAAKDLGIPGYIEECQAKKGSIGQKETASIKHEVVNEPAKPVVKTDSTAITRIAVPEVKRVTSGEMISEDYDKLLSEALGYQRLSDSIQKNIDNQKAGLDNLGYREKTELRSKISVSQHLADSLQNLADSTFDRAQVIMNKTPFVTTTAVKDTSRKAQVTISKDTSAHIVPTMVKPQEKPVKADTVKTTSDKSIQSQTKSPAPVYSYFEINPKPVYKPGDKIEINPKIPPGLIYRIQVAVFKNPVAPSYFKGISPVFGFKSATPGLTVYYAGMFRRVADANKALVSVRQKGFKDSFVATFLEGRQVSAERAAVLEKEWGKKPFNTVVSVAPETKADTIPPTLNFRVEVMRSKKPVKEDVVEGIRKMAGTRGMESIKLDDGTEIFLVGMFITYESAAEFTDLLVRNGYRDAKVTAWLGKKGIPVETARELFDQLK